MLFTVGNVIVSIGRICNQFLTKNSILAEAKNLSRIFKAKILPKVKLKSRIMKREADFICLTEEFIKSRFFGYFFINGKSSASPARAKH